MAIELVHQFNFEYLPVENLNEIAKNECRQSKAVRTSEYEENVLFLRKFYSFCVCFVCM